MADGKEKLIKLYGTLKTDGYDLPEYKQFEQDMSDSNNLKKLHGTLVNDGYDLPDETTFRSDMGEKKKGLLLSSFGTNLQGSGRSGGLALGKVGAVPNIKTKEDEKKELTEYVYNLKTEEQKQQSKPTVENSRQLAYNQGEKKLAEIMSGDGKADPVLAATKKMGKPTDAQDYLNNYMAKRFVEDKISGSQAKEILATTEFGQKGDDNVTASALRNRVNEYEKTASPFRNIEPNYLAKDQVYDAAIRAYANKNTHFAEQMKAAGIDLNKNDIRLSLGENNTKVGNILSQVFNDPDLFDMVENERPDLAPILKEASENLIYDNKDFGKIQLANEISREMQNSGYNKIDPIFNLKSEAIKTGDVTAQSLYADDPNKLQFYEENKDDILNSLDAPSLFTGFAEAGKGFGKGIIKTFTEPFSPTAKTMREGWEKEASHVSADPKGLVKFLSDSGHALGFVASIGATGNVMGATGFINPKNAAAVSTALGFFGDQLEQGKMKYPNSPIKAYTSALVNTGMYTALSYQLFPAAKVEQAFKAVKPAVSKVVENLASGSVTREVARQQLNTIGKKTIDVLSSGLEKNLKVSAEMTGITILNKSLDKVMGMDDETFKQYHPEGEEADTFKSMFLSNIIVNGLAAYGQNRAKNNEAKQSIYEAASNPNRYRNVIEAAAAGKNVVETKQLLDNLDYVTKIKSELDGMGLSEKQKKDYLFNSLQSKVLNEAKEMSPDATMKRRHTDRLKHIEEINQGILEGKDADEIVTTVEKKQQDELQKQVDEGKDAADELESMTKTYELDSKEIDTKIKDLDKESATYSVQKEKLEQQKEDKKKEYDKKSQKLERPSLIAKSIEAVDKDLPEYLRNGAKEDIEGTLRDAAEQLNSTPGEAKTARNIYGNTLSDIALKLFPDAKTKIDPNGELAKLNEEVYGVAENIDPKTEEVIEVTEQPSPVNIPSNEQGGKVDSPKKTIIKLAGKFANIEGAEKAVSDINKLGEVNPYNESQVVIDGVKVKVVRDGGKIWLQEISAIEQGKGKGTEVLDKIKKIADESGIDIVLHPTEIGNTKESDLIKWYKEHGFEDYTQGRLIYKTEAKNETTTQASDKGNESKSSEKEVITEPIPDKDSGGTVPPKEKEPVDAVEGDGSIGGITHAANEIRRKDRALPEYQKEPQAFEEWNNEAEKAIKEGYDVDKLIDRIEKGHDPTPVENAIRKIYVATLDAEITKNPTDELLAKQKKFIEAGDLANSRAGRNLVSLKGENSPMESISDFYVAKMEASGVGKLTEQQKKETKEAFDNVQKADENAAAAMQKYVDEIAKLKAENELLKQKKATPKKDKGDFAQQRKGAIQGAKDALKKLRESGTLQSSIPFAQQVKELAAIAPHVKKYIGGLLGEGVYNLKEVVQKAHEEFKGFIDWITEKDIHNIIAGEHNVTRPTRNELAAKMRDLRDEAYYVNKLERLLAGREPKNETKRIKRNAEIEELKQKIRDFQKEERDALKEPKEEVDIDLKKLEAIRKRNEKQAAEIQERIKKGDFETKKPVPFLEDPEMQKKFPKEYKAALDAIVKKEDARHEFDVALLKDQMSRRNLGKKGIDLVGDILGTTRALVTGIDASGIGIQNLVAMIAHPRSAAKALPASFTDFVSAKNQDRWLARVHNSRLFPLAQKFGLDITEPQSLKASQKEEIFSHNLLDRKIKFKGKTYVISKYLTKPFERIFTGLGNRMRWNLWERGVEKLLEDGYTPEKHPKEFESLAKVLNTETGRGKLHPQIDKAYNLVSSVIWSPRLMASRLNILGLGDLGNAIAGGKKGYYGGLTPKMREYALKDVAKFIAFGSTMLALAGLSFADDVETDPNSSTFGTFSADGRRYNIWGGFTQYVRLVTKLSMGGENQKGEFKKSGQLRTSLRFLWSKTTPVVGTAIGWGNKDRSGNPRDYMGQPMTAEGSLESTLVPLSIRGIIKGLEKEGMKSVIWTGVPSFVGFNVNYESDFEDSADKSRTREPRERSERPKRERAERE